MIGSLFYWGIAPLSKPPWGHPCCIGGSPPWFWGVGEGFINTPPHHPEEGEVISIFLARIDFLLYRCSLLDIQRIYFLVHDNY